MKIAELTIWAHDVQNHVAHGKEVSRKACAVGPGALNAKGLDCA